MVNKDTIIHNLIMYNIDPLDITPKLKDYLMKIIGKDIQNK
jgi:hypothetical protein